MAKERDMRKLVLVVAGLVLAACQPQEPELAGPPPAESTPAPAPAPVEPPPLATAIPAKFHGKWDASAEACGRASIMTLTVSANELRFHESIGEINSVTPEGENAVTVKGRFEGEGEQWEGTMRLELSADGNTLTTTNNGTVTPRVRCP
jgi:hypothetical protein